MVLRLPRVLPAFSSPRCLESEIEDKHLVLVITIQRHEESYHRETKYTHSVGVVRISDTLHVEYFRGRINYLHKSRYRSKERKPPANAGRRRRSL